MNWYLIALLAATLSVCGCTKEDPIPEERDPIFKDLEKRETEHTKLSEEGRAKLKDLHIALEKSEPNSLSRKDVERDIAKVKRELMEHEQWARYYRIRTQRRRLVDRMTYRKSLATKSEWPNPNEYSEYLVNRRLVEANRNWNAHVPKLQDRLNSHQSKESSMNREEPSAEGAPKKGH